MSFRLFDLSGVLERIFFDEDSGEVTVNGIVIGHCYVNASFGPREIIDHEYWEDPLAYVYAFAMQTDFGFPIMRPEKMVPSEDNLAIQLVRIRHDLLPIAGYIAEYTRIYLMAHASFFPRNRLREAVGLDDFDYFVPDLENDKVTYVIGEDTYVIDIRDKVELETWTLVDDTIGRTNAYNPQNAAFVEWLLEPPFFNEDPSNDREVSPDVDDEFRRRVKSNICARLRLEGYVSN